MCPHKAYVQHIHGKIGGKCWVYSRCSINEWVTSCSDPPTASCWCPDWASHGSQTLLVSPHSVLIAFSPRCEKNWGQMKGSNTLIMKIPHQIPCIHGTVLTKLLTAKWRSLVRTESQGWCQNEPIFPVAGVRVCVCVRGQLLLWVLFLRFSLLRQGFSLVKFPFFIYQMMKI